MYKLRELDKKDLSTINQWRNNPKLIHNLEAPFRYINAEVDEKWYNNYINNRYNQVRCAIVSNENDDIIGLVSLTNIDHFNQSAAFHIMIGDENNQGSGIGTFAVIEMLKHAFNNLNLQRIELGTIDYNERAQHIYEKVGFVKEGIKRKAIYKNGRFVDEYIYAILKNDFKY